mmetsp:Transcript_5859/g.26353  ORF Transcript_5859/g.26353 Transcript_5859/m.26353 type:complete len:323 (+) Transcript_5859:1392-2360(+)
MMRRERLRRQAGPRESDWLLCSPAVVRRRGPSRRYPARADPTHLAARRPRHRDWGRRQRESGHDVPGAGEREGRVGRRRGSRLLLLRRVQRHRSEQLARQLRARLLHVFVPVRLHHLRQVRRGVLEAGSFQRVRVVLLRQRERRRRRLHVHHVAQPRLAYGAQSCEVVPISRHEQVLGHGDVQVDAVEVGGRRVRGSRGRTPRLILRPTGSPTGIYPLRCQSPGGGGRTPRAARAVPVVRHRSPPASVREFVGVDEVHQQPEHGRANIRQSHHPLRPLAHLRPGPKHGPERRRPRGHDQRVRRELLTLNLEHAVRLVRVVFE